METQLALELWLETLELEGRSLETLRTYRSLCKALPHLATELQTASKTELAAFLRTYRASHAPASARSLLVTWQNFLNWCVREEFIRESPLAGIRQPKIKAARDKAGYRSETITTVFRYLQAVKGPVARRDEALIAVLLDSGLRVSELCRLELSDFVDGELLIRFSKTGRARLVPLGPSSQGVLSRYLRMGRPKLRPQCQALFVTTRGEAMSRFTVALVLRRLGEKTETNLSAHRFRHTFATEHLKAGTTMESLRRLGGWSSYSMIQTYAHLRTDDLASQHEASPFACLTQRR